MGSRISKVSFIAVAVMGLFLVVYLASNRNTQEIASVSIGSTIISFASNPDRGAVILEECGNTACVATRAAELEAQAKAEREAIQAEADRQAAASSSHEPAYYEPAYSEPERTVQVIRVDVYGGPVNCGVDQYGRPFPGCPDLP
ncbi:MAG: hypothetical protein ACYC5A_00930 [Thermoleophilia bacterium]